MNANKPRRIMPATAVRVRLGEVIRSLEREDVVIEKDGIPVALLTKYPGALPAEKPPPAARAYEEALAKRAEPGGVALMDAAMAAEWAGIDPDELVAKIYRWRAEGGTSGEVSAPAMHFRAEMTADELSDDDDDGEIPPGQRYLYSRDETKTQKRVADGDGPSYTA